MKWKVVRTVLVSMLLLFTMLCTGTQEVEAESTTVVYVDPPISYAAVGQTFSINVSIANVTDLWCFELKLGYNTTILDIVEATIQPFLNEPTWLAKNEVYEDKGWYWLAITSLYPTEPKNGSGPLVTLNFEVTGKGSCALDLYDTIFADSEMEDIPHSVEDGYFEYRPLEHDIAAFLDVPAYHLTPGDSALLNATVLNGGLNNETDVELQLLINGSLVNSTVIGSLQVGSSYTLSYLWTTSTVEGIYNVTAYALPVPNEDFTLNNMESARVPVSYVIRVPYHYPTIQRAVDAASPGATILVSTGTYYEWLTIDKSLTLVGEESSTPIIDGSGMDIVISVTADNVDISNFIIQNGGAAGIFLSGSNSTISSNTITNNMGWGIETDGNNNTIIGNMITNNFFDGIEIGGCNNTINGNKISENWKSGIDLPSSDNNVIIGNKISNNRWYGIRLFHSAHNNIISGNIITNNTDAGICLYSYSKYWYCYDNFISRNIVSDNGIGISTNYTENNVIYHNSFINNAEQVSFSDSYDIWDNGCEGNYWSDYAGEDLDGDGIGDTLLPHQEVDYYPLMNPYIPGDVNHDAINDIFDGVIIALAFGSHPGHPRWNPHADLNEDEIINIKDIAIWTKNFGMEWDWNEMKPRRGS